MSTTPISPKVAAGAFVAAVVGLLLQYLTTLTPDAFAFLGQYQGLAFLFVTLAGGSLAAWWKTDPLRVTSQDPPPEPLPATVPVSVADVVPVYVPESAPPV